MEIWSNLRKFKVYLLDKKGFNYRLYLVFLIFAIGGFIDYFKFHIFIKSSTDLILYFTLLAILSYSFETYRLRDETYRLSEAATTQTKQK